MIAGELLFNASSDAKFENVLPKRAKKGVLVIGGGPAGLAAAISAARAGSAVVVADRMDRVGKKLLASGSGRCNLSNTNISLKNYHGAGAGPAFSIIQRLGAGFAEEFMKSVGVLTAVEGGSRIYPRTFQASTVLNALRLEAARLGVVELTSSEAVSINVKGDAFIVSFRNAPRIEADRVIVAAGGKATPSLGSNGSGYELMTRLGHRLVAPAPALAQIYLAPRGIKGLKGVRVYAGLSMNQNIRCDDFHETGELLFTEHGLSGIPAMNMSLTIAPLLGADRDKSFALVDASRAGSGAYLSIDLLPEYTSEKIAGFLHERAAQNPSAPLEEALRGIMPKQIAVLIAKAAGDPGIGKNTDKNNWDAVNISRAAGIINRAAGIIKDWRHEIVGVAGFNDAQVALGGLSFDDIKISTLESKLIKGLYAAGEILDATGDCGGYNLHWAWVSGCLAGSEAGR